MKSEKCFLGKILDFWNCVRGGNYGSGGGTKQVEINLAFEDDIDAVVAVGWHIVIHLVKAKRLKELEPGHGMCYCDQSIEIQIRFSKIIYLLMTTQHISRIECA
jgi:hypothetical protein